MSQSARRSLQNRKQRPTHCNAFTTYIRHQWIDCHLLKPATWSVFMQPVRTKNDVEGWHGALNRHASRGNLSFYLMVRLLVEQANLVNMQVRLVSDKKLKLRQRKQYRSNQAKIAAAWNDFNNGTKSALALLRTWCSHVVAPNIE
ncbi:uncharacterized protein LOC135500187 [Lineus longissimus]|uniref:uncharacterized protein LOC135500187 n=1 Tax=Lineus longissimus TaxID=88925 RepID=UPI00315D0AB2